MHTAVHCCKTCHFANQFPEIQGVKGEPLILNGKMHSKVFSLVSELGFEGETIEKQRIDQLHASVETHNDSDHRRFHLSMQFPLDS